MLLSNYWSSEALIDNYNINIDNYNFYFNGMIDIFGKSINNLSMSSTKSMTGHLLGAAGSVEAIYSIKSINENTLPCTINLDNPIPSSIIN